MHMQMYLYLTALFFTHNRCSLHCSAAALVEHYNKLPGSHTASQANSGKQLFKDS